jgi:cell division protein FtsW
MKRNRIDMLLLVFVLTLLGVGIMMVFSASAIRAMTQHDNVFYFQVRQISFGAGAFLLLWYATKFDHLKFTENRRPLILLGIGMLLLVGVFLFGAKINGARRWFNLGIANFQPSELVKIILIIYFADLFARRGSDLRDWKSLAFHSMLLFFTVGMIAIQPDFSSAAMITMIILIMASMSHVRIKHLLAALVFVLPLLGTMFVLNGYQLGRLSAWWGNLGNPMGSGHQVKQSLIAFGRGGLFGVGPGMSKQKFLFLPDSHTDFVFAILGEEWGFLGTTVVLTIFLLILWRGIKIARNAPTPFSQFLAIGLTMNIVLYAFVNAGVTTMVLPTTGLPMPFISYGGTSIIFNCISVGILLNISRGAVKRPLGEHVRLVHNQQSGLSQRMVGAR